ncbi:hypothetical protein U3516DRAFT_814828, partial [Neocallimastix sp. 'constans']
MDPNWNRQGNPMNPYYPTNKDFGMNSYGKSPQNGMPQNNPMNLNVLANPYSNLSRNDIKLLQMQQGMSNSPHLNSAQLIGGSHGLSLNAMNPGNSPKPQNSTFGNNSPHINSLYLNNPQAPSSGISNLINTQIPITEQNKYLNRTTNATTIISPKLMSSQSQLPNSSSANHLKPTLTTLPNSTANISMMVSPTIKSSTNPIALINSTKDAIVSSPALTQAGGNLSQMSYLQQQQQQQQQQTTHINSPGLSQSYNNLSIQIQTSLPPNSQQQNLQSLSTSPLSRTPISSQPLMQQIQTSSVQEANIDSAKASLAEINSIKQNSNLMTNVSPTKMTSNQNQLNSLNQSQNSNVNLKQFQTD